MDVDLALVSSVQLREMLQQQSPHSPQVQELAKECERLIDTGEEVLKKKGPDARVEQVCQELREALLFFRSILAADENLAQQKREDADRHHHQQAADASGSRRLRRSASESGRKQQRSSSSRRRERKEKSGAAAATGEPEGAGQGTSDSLFSDWPQADFAFETNTPPTMAVAFPAQPDSLWGASSTGNPFENSAAVDAAAAAPAGSTAGQGHKRVSSRARAGSKGGSSSGHAATANLSSSDSTSSESESSSASSNSRNSKESKTNTGRNRLRREKNRTRQRRTPPSDAAESSHQELATAAEASAEQRRPCCCISMASLQAFLQPPISSTMFRLSVELSLPSHKVKKAVEGASPSGIVTSSTKSDGGQEVAWPHRVRFWIRSKRSNKGKKSRDGSSSSGEILQALQREGQMRFLIDSLDNGWPTFGGDFALHSLMSGEMMFHRVSLHPVSQRGITGSGSDCGFLSFSILVETGKADDRDGAEAFSAGDGFLQQPSGRSKLHRREEGKGETRDQQAHSSRYAGTDDKWKASEADRAALYETAQENHTLQHQNNLFQAHIQQQQQSLLQHQQQLQAFHAQIQQMNAQLTDAYQRLAAYEAQHQQQLSALQQLQQQRDGEAAAAAAEKLRLQKQVDQLEIELEAAKEAEEKQQQQVRRHRKELDRLQREVQDQEEQLRISNAKTKEQEETIAELTTLLDNARHRIRNERQRNEELVNKLEAAAKTESALKAELQASQDEAAEGNRQLLSLTWGLESPPVFSGLPDSPPERQRQREQQRQRLQNEQGYLSAASDGDLRLHSLPDTEREQKQTFMVPRWAPASSNVASIRMPPSWSDPEILRRVIPLVQPADAGWEDSLLIAMQRGYSALMLAEASFSKEPLRGILLNSAFLKVEWRSSILSGAANTKACYPQTHLSGGVAATALFAASVVSSLSAMSVITVTLEQEVFEGGETANSHWPLALTGEVFAAEWRTLEMQEDAVLLDLLPSHLRSAVSLLALGGRFAILPVAEAAHVGSLAAGGPGVMCIHASAAFPVLADDESTAGDTKIACLVILSVRRNATLEAAQQAHVGTYRNRQPGGLLRVRCRSTALRSSTLEALLQQLMTPEQLLDAAAAIFPPKRGLEG